MHFNFTLTAPTRAQLFLYDKIGDPADDAPIAGRLAKRLAQRKAAAAAKKNSEGDDTGAAGNDSGELFIYKEISEYWGIGAQQFAEDLKALGPVDSIDVRINSYGGSVFEGFAIYHMLAQHTAKITTHVDGIAASIASVIAMAGDEIRMASPGRLMIHNAWGVAIGDHRTLRSEADVLESLTGSCADIYAERSNVPREELITLMDKETWFTADEAIEKGLADTKAEGKKVAACLWRPSWAARDESSRRADGEPAGPIATLTPQQVALLHARLAESRRAEAQKQSTR